MLPYIYDWPEQNKSVNILPSDICGLSELGFLGLGASEIQATPAVLQLSWIEKSFTS